VKPMIRTFVVAGFVLVVASSSSPVSVAAHSSQQAAVQPPVKPAASDALASRLERHLPAVMDEALVPGLQIAVIRGGRLAWHGAFGLANGATKVPVTDDSIFEAASLSKPVFAYAVLKLVDAGKLDLDTPLTKYLPGSYDVRGDDRLGQITARHVLSHRSGFPNWRGADEALAIHFAPGERFSYSGEAFVYLAFVVERITGETLEAFVARRVFQPLGMMHSSFVWQERYEGTKVYNHNLLGRPSGRSRPWRANAAASLHTTALDYARFVAAVMAGTGLGATTARQMLTPQSRPDEAGINTATQAPTGRTVPSLAWGLGWGLEQEQDRWAFWHWGDNGDTRAFVAASPARRLGFVMFVNSRNGLSIVPQIFEDVLGGRSASFDWLKVARIAPAELRFLHAILSLGAPRALEEYRTYRAAHPEEPAVAEDGMNTIGYSLVRDKQVKDAIEVFKQNVADHPESWNVYDSLGEAYAADGNKELAIRNYERSLELNPGNAGGREALKKLRGQ
jgi:CubicO group peptidase (beta-lactamase class C family)